MNKIKNEIWDKGNEIWDESEVIDCPVCGRKVQMFDVCVCGWENTGETNIDGGPNKMALEEAKKAYRLGKRLR